MTTRPDAHAILRSLRALVHARRLDLDAAMRVLDACCIPRERWDRPDDAPIT